jgi:flagellar basal body-associated protein FliL
MSDRPTPGGAPEPSAMSKLPPRRRLWIMIGTGVALLLAGVWLVFAKLPSFLTRSTGDATPASKAAGSSGAPAAEGRKIQATLFYVSDDGAELIPVNREVPYGASASEQARHIVEAQVAAAPQGYVSAIAAGTTVRSVFLAGRGEAYVDLSPEAAAAHSGGSLNEALAVFAIVNALTANLADVTSVQILVNGKEVDTLAGHIDLRQPLSQGTKWVRKAQ